MTAREQLTATEGLLPQLWNRGIQPRQQPICISRAVRRNGLKLNGASLRRLRHSRTSTALPSHHLSTRSARSVFQRLGAPVRSSAKYVLPLYITAAAASPPRKLDRDDRPAGAVLSAQRASRDEVISALLVGLPAAGHGITQSLPAAIEAYDAQ